MKTYMVKEIFGPTIQGEGTYAGTAVKFLRFAGCNKWNGRPETKAKAVCWYCDTDFYGGTKMTAPDIIQDLDNLGPVKTLVISGGEPTLQIDEYLLTALKAAGYRLHLETNGSRPLGALRYQFFHVTMSPKQTPDKTKLEACSDLKLLYPNPIEGVTPEAFKDFPHVNKYVQPLDDEDKSKSNLEATIKFVTDNPGWRLSLQLHKILGVK